jgi:1-acyl-sn-glycerol-3-phosphate acyltransferase
MHKLFIAIHLFVSRNKALAIVIAVAFLLVFGFFASRISFEEDITRLIPKSERNDETTKVLGQLNFADKITVIINAEKGTTPQELTEVATVFLDSLHSCDRYINGVQGKVDDENIQEAFEFVYANVPLFLDDNDYAAIEQQIQKDSIAATVSANYRSILSPSGLVTKDFILQDPFGISFIALKKLQQLGMGDEFNLQDGFVITKDKQKLLLFINPKFPGNETEKNTLFADKLNSIKEHINYSFKAQANIEYYGGTLIAVANAEQIKSDIKTTSIVAITALMLIFMIYYRKLYIPLIISLPTVFGVVFAVALLYFLRGTISAISLSIGSILLGVTIDYALHILTHYKHNSDIRVLYKDITKPLIMSSTTTAVAFICLLFVKSEALQDLGIFAAISVVVTALFSLLIVPHLYKPTDKDMAHGKTIIDGLANVSFHNSRPLLIFSIIIIIASLFTFNKVVFNNDLSQLNFIPPDIKKAEKNLESATNLTSKSLYLASYGSNIDDVLQSNSNLSRSLAENKDNRQLLSYSSIGSIVLSKQEQQQKIDRWNSFWNMQRKQEVKEGLIAEGSKLGFKASTYSRFYDLLNKEFRPIQLKDYLNVKTLFLKEFISEKNGFYTVSTIVKVSNTQRDALVKKLSAKPKLLVIDRQQMNETFLGNLKNDFNSLVNYSFVAVILILFFFFRRIELVIISCIPILITAIVTAGIMGMFNIQLNIFSTIVCTLVFGHGVDFSIFMTSALQKEYTYGRNEMATYRVSILLAVLTTVLGIGALVFAGHPALKSISSISLIGVFAALVITFIFYPILFRSFLSGRVNRGKAPFEFRTLIHSILSFTYYGLGGFLLSVISLIFITILPVSKKWKMKAFRYTMSKFMKSVLYTNPWLKKKVTNTHGETFNKPAIIIANHTSFLDILAVGMLSPKIIYLVSDWVYNSPIFGIGVKLAGFYPVSQGLEAGLEHLRKKVEEGYSLVVFPEGTRSEDNYIRRFHKGAFYLAEAFNIDIVPVVIHGNSEVLPKGDFIINDGPLTLKILERISPHDIRFGAGYAERTKGISRYFKDTFMEMRAEIEGVSYFKKKIINSFAYKEPGVIKEVKEGITARLELFYRLSRYIDSKAAVLHLADDHGEGDIIMVLQEPHRKIISFIENEDKRDVAKTNYIVKKRNIVYANAVLEATGKQFDVMVISAAVSVVTDELLKNIDRIILAGNGLTEEVDDAFEAEHEEEGFRIVRRKRQ